METTNTTSILNRIGDLKNRYSDRKLTAEQYTDEDTGFIGIRILDDTDTTVAVVEPTYSIVDGVSVEDFSPVSVIDEITEILNR